MLRSIGLPEIMVICFVAVFLFGGKAFGSFSKGLAESFREFKKVSKEFKEAETEVKKSV